MAVCFLALSLRAQTKQIEESLASDSVATYWTKWSKKECEHILKFSPWADYDTEYGPEFYVDLTTGVTYTGSVLFNWELTRFDSALPVRQAQLRLLQIKEQYDKMKPEEKKAFDNRHTKDLSEDENTPIVISWTSDVGRADSARQMAIKLSDDNFVMPLKITLSGFRDFLGPRIANKAEYVFPRKINGVPIFTESNRTIILVLGAVLPYHGKVETLGPLNQKDFDFGFNAVKEFSVYKMKYRGKLEY